MTQKLRNTLAVARKTEIPTVSIRILSKDTNTLTLLRLHVEDLAHGIQSGRDDPSIGFGGTVGSAGALFPIALGASSSSSCWRSVLPRGKRRALRARDITPRIARRGIDSSERLGRYRWVVERTFSWLLGCCRLGVRYEWRAELLQALLHLACALICLRFLSLALE